MKRVCFYGNNISRPRILFEILLFFAVNNVSVLTFRRVFGAFEA